MFLVAARSAFYFCVGIETHPSLQQIVRRAQFRETVYLEEW